MLWIRQRQQGERSHRRKADPKDLAPDGRRPWSAVVDPEQHPTAEFDQRKAALDCISTAERSVNAMLDQFKSRQGVTRVGGTATELYEDRPMALKRCSCSMRISLRTTAAAWRLRSSGEKGRNAGTGTGLRSSSTATMVKKQLLTWRATWVRMSSATTLMPTSIDDVPVRLTAAISVTSSPT